MLSQMQHLRNSVSLQSTLLVLVTEIGACCLDLLAAYYLDQSVRRTWDTPNSAIQDKGMERTLNNRLKDQD